RTATTAKEIGLLDNVQDTTLGVAASRELVAELIFRAMNVPMVKYNLIVKDYVPVKDNETLGQREFDLVGPTDTKDDWGNPGYLWKYEVNGKDAETTISIAPVATYDVATSQCDIATVLDEDGKYIPVEIYDNGVDRDATINATATKAMLGGQGTQIAVYDYTDAYDNQVNRLVIIDTYLARVDDVNEATYDDAGHEKTPASSDIRVWMVKDVQPKEGAISSTAYDEGAYILVNYNEKTKEFTDVQEAEAFVGAQTRIWNDADRHTIGGTDYMDAEHYALDGAGNKTERFTWFLDQYGNVIGSVAMDRDSYAVIKDMIWVRGTPGYAEATLVNMDGTEYTAIVETLDGLNPAETSWTYNDATPSLNDSQDAAFNGNDALVSTDSSKNDLYEGYAMYRVTTNDDDSVILQGYNGAGKYYVDYADNATLDIASSAILVNNKVTVHVDDSTQFLVKDGDTYTAYTGTDNLPDFATVEVFYDGVATNAANRIADYVYIKDFTLKTDDGEYLFVTNDTSSYEAGSTPTYEMDAVVDGADRTIKTTDKDLMDKLKANVGKLFDVEFTNGYLTKAELVNEANDTDTDCNYLSQAITVGSNVLLCNGVSYHINSADVVSTVSGIEDYTDITQKVADEYGIWVISETSPYNVATTVYVGEKLDDNTGASVTVTYNTNKTVDATLKGTIFTANLAAGDTFTKWTAEPTSNLATVAPAEGTDLKSDTSFTVTAENGAQKIYTVNVTETPAKAQLVSSADWTYKFGDAVVDAPNCYAPTANGTTLDAVKMALDNAKKISLKDLAVPADGKYTIAVTSASKTYHAIAVYSSYADAAKAGLTSLTTVNAKWENALARGYYIVVGGSASTSTECDYYEAFYIVD
ncbi:hypothetical protein, partial [Evtepia sp.]